MSDIFQEIWDADQSGNGVPALRPGESREPARGFVEVDERSTAVGSGHRVLRAVSIPEAKRRTYALCEALFDNYALERTLRERVRPYELQEELDFIDAILDAAPIEVARRYLEISLDVSISRTTLAAMIRESWFAIGRSGSQPDASGFEHVFVGEQSSSRDKAGGYHFWYKYWLDDSGASTGGAPSADRIEYLGTRYGGAQQPDKGVLVPEIVTLEMVWQAPLGDVANPAPGETRRLHKPTGGFFVGPSPEGLIALGLVRARAQSTKTARINGATYQLDLHRLDGNPRAIRTFFPRFVRYDIVDLDPVGEPAPEPAPAPAPPEPQPVPAPSADGTLPFRIVAGMINPRNPEGGREFLQILNVADRVASLRDWQVVAPNGVVFTLADIDVASGEVFKFVVPASQGMLRNREGTILLRAPAGGGVLAYSYSREQAGQEGRPIVFLDQPR
ncbi:MAG: hypothetical protein KDH15_18040 [Rhodocyclaceae bacterium]|nr:hypothetical protein [Rhodocyclaceae bacterium]